MDFELSGRLQRSALAHAAGYTLGAYVGPWNAYVFWCGSLMRPRTPLPADDLTTPLYFSYFMDKSNTFSIAFLKA